MKRLACYLGLLFLAVVGTFCSRPLSQFAIQSTDAARAVAPAWIQFENNSENADSFYWDFGDGMISNEVNPKHRFLQSGNYAVQLTAIKGKKRRTLEKRVLITPPEDCLVLMQTDKGELLIKLLDETPLHRDNFLKLVEEGFFDGLLFHRVIDGFMIQGGDPQSKDADVGTRLGSGGPGYQVPAEFHEQHYHYKGALAAARQGDAVNPEKKSSGSQFYIVHGKEVTNDMLDVLQARKGITYSPDQRSIYAERGGTPFLDNEYTVFGQVIQGMPVIDSIATVATGSADRPIDNVSMKLIVIK